MEEASSSYSSTNKRIRKKPPAVTVPQTKKCIVAIKKTKQAGQMFFATEGQHLNLDEFFQTQEYSKQLEQSKKIQEEKKNQLLLQEAKKNARAVLSAKGPLLEETYKSYKKPDIKFLCKWKQIKIVKDEDGNTPSLKRELFNLYLLYPKPPVPKPWSKEEESELQELLKPNMPLPQTHLGVAAKQMAVTTATVTMWLILMNKVAPNCSNQLPFLKGSA